MNYLPKDHKEYFTFAYQTGSDIWSHVPYRYRAESMLPRLPKDALVLDLGAGRGLWMNKLVGLGYRVLGIDYVPAVVEKVNKNIQEEGFADRARAVVGDVLDIPFVDAGFDLLTDIGTLQHLARDDWQRYVRELARVLRPNGYFLQVSLSRRTERFLGWNPSLSESGDFEKFGVHYHFFSKDELEQLFGLEFHILDQQYETFPSQSDPEDEIVFVFTLMQKNNRGVS